MIEGEATVKRFFPEAISDPAPAVEPRDAADLHPQVRATGKLRSSESWSGVFRERSGGPRIAAPIAIVTKIPNGRAVKSPAASLWTRTPLGVRCCR